MNRAKIITGDGFGWGCNEPWCLPEDPIKYAEIKLPEESEEKENG